jgi:putative nucleotidyltransferase with HDIG domain
MKQKIFQIPSYILFIIATLLIVFLFPREGKFRYAFTEGKPWHYSLLTAPFDFPIYKPAEQLNAEKDSVTLHFIPYFQLNKEVYTKQIARFNEDHRNFSHEKWDNRYKQYVDRMLREIYAIGIVSNDDYQFLRENDFSFIRLIQENNVTTPFSTNDIFTIRSAYSHILANIPTDLDADVLRLMNINNYLQENLLYNAVLSDKVKADDLQKISPSVGMVQAGERIIDKGEIINAKTYNILRSLKYISEKEQGGTQRQLAFMLGVFILISGIMTCFLLYFIYFRKTIYQKKKDVFFLLSISSLFIILTELTISYSLFNVYIIPYVIIPIVVRTFFESRTAQVTHLCTILICSLMVPFAFEFIIVQLLVGLVAMYVLKDLTQRSELIKCAVFVYFAYGLSYLGFQLFHEGDLSKINWIMFLYFGINFVFVMFTYSFIYIVEKLFGYISNVTLVELSDINTPTLIRLSEQSPGTFQHSLQVSMLGTAAAAKVGANPQLVRTGALYHDLGKIATPAYFVENTIEGSNPHEHLSLEQSARIITNHVPEGVKVAEKYGLPSAIIKFMLTHHGKGKAKYFYNSYKNKYPDQPIDESAFAYSGVNPDTKETAILMMADAVEAASRSLKDYNEESICELVNRIIDSQITDGLLNDAPLSFQDITAIKNVFVEKLLSVYHSRISYPEIAK